MEGASSRKERGVRKAWGNLYLNSLLSLNFIVPIVIFLNIFHLPYYLRSKDDWNSFSKEAKKIINKFRAIFIQLRVVNINHRELDFTQTHNKSLGRRV